MTKTCTRCGETKARDDFSPYYQGWGDGYRPECKSCRNTRQMEYHRVKRANRPPSICDWCGSEFRRKPGQAFNQPGLCCEEGRAVRKRTAKYGIELDEYRNLLDRAAGYCEVCHDPFPDSGQYVGYRIDHNHQTGKIRGLLCHKCNILLGYVEGSEDRVEQIIEYLSAHTPEAVSEA